MNPALPDDFLRLPLAHRACHGPGRPENGTEAIAAAISAGYGIEIDVQLTSDGQAMVFHDDDLDRLTPATGPVRRRSAAELSSIRLSGGTGTIPTLRAVLDQVAGQVPLLIEIKDQDGAMGPNVGALEQDVARQIDGYAGPLALMSFNPHSVAALARLCPAIPRGLTTWEWTDTGLPDACVAHLVAIADFDRTGASFVSHHHSDLARPRVAELKARNVPILCWTIRSPTEEAQARRIADGITFEGYAAAFPA